MERVATGLILYAYRTVLSIFGHLVTCLASDEWIGFIRELLDLLERRFLVDDLASVKNRINPEEVWARHPLYVLVNIDLLGVGVSDGRIRHLVFWLVILGDAFLLSDVAEFVHSGEQSKVLDWLRFWGYQLL